MIRKLLPTMLLLPTLSVPASAQPIELADPIDVGAALREIQVDVPLDDPFDELRSDYALAAGAKGLLVTWVEADRTVFAAILDQHGATIVPRFELHTGTTMVRTVRAAFVAGRYVVVASDVRNLMVMTRFVTVSEAGAVLSSFEFGASGEECDPASLTGSGNYAVVACTDRRIIAADLAGDTAKSLTFFIDGSFDNAPPQLDCRQGSCVAAGPHFPENVLDKNVALIHFELSGTLDAPQMLGYRDATNSRIAVLQTADGVMVAARSWMSPVGDINGQARERLHGFFVGNPVNAIDPLAEAVNIRDPRLATNGASIALAYRVNGAPTMLTALSLTGEPRANGTVEISALPSWDVRLKATATGAYAVAYDVDTKLLVRIARADPIADAGPLGPGDAGADATDHPSEAGTEDAGVASDGAPATIENRSSGCSCAISADGEAATGLFLAALGLIIGYRRERRRRS